MRNTTDLRQKVLQASLALIEEGGLDRLSMREVARKSGVSHQAPYYYFGDREAIRAAIAGEGFSRLGQSFQRAVARAGSEPAKTLEAIGRASQATGMAGNPTGGVVRQAKRGMTSEAKSSRLSRSSRRSA